LLQNPNERRPNYRPPVDTGPFFIETKSATTARAGQWDSGPARQL
jgi:hypothetical protein